VVFTLIFQGILLSKVENFAAPCALSTFGKLQMFDIQNIWSPEVNLGIAFYKQKNPRNVANHTKAGLFSLFPPHSSIQYTVALLQLEQSV
jgi:hypothetical protein